MSCGLCQPIWLAWIGAATVGRLCDGAGGGLVFSAPERPCPYGVFGGGSGKYALIEEVPNLVEGERVQPVGGRVGVLVGAGDGQPSTTKQRRTCPTRLHRNVLLHARRHDYASTTLATAAPGTQRLPPCRAFHPAGSTMIASPRNTAPRARSANFSGVIGRNPSQDFEEFLIADAGNPSELAAGEGRGLDRARTKHRQLHAVALGRQPQRLRDRDDGVFGGGVARLARSG
jgi:hypothetical protein